MKLVSDFRQCLKIHIIFLSVTANKIGKYTLTDKVVDVRIKENIYK